MHTTMKYAFFIFMAIAVLSACSDLEMYTLEIPEGYITETTDTDDNLDSDDTSEEEEDTDTDDLETEDNIDTEDNDYDLEQQIADCQTDGAAMIYAGDDIATYLDAVDEDGNYTYDQLIIVDAVDYYLGTYYATHSIRISACDPDNRPTLHGAICSGNTEDDIIIELSDLIFDGAEYNYTNSSGTTSTMGTQGQMFSARATGTVTLLSIDGCIIKNYTKSICYDNYGATIENIIINDCVCDSTGASNGGGTFDFRKGSLGNLIVSNSTFMNGSRDFTRIASSATCTFFTNCTFFRVCNIDYSNNTGLIRQPSGSFYMTNCIIDQLGTSDGETYVSYGYWTKSSTYYGADFNYSNVYYCNSPNIWTGYLTSAPDGVSSANTGIATSTSFNTTSDGYIDITIQNSAFPEGVGDPRWYY